MNRLRLFAFMAIAAALSLSCHDHSGGLSLTPSPLGALALQDIAASMAAGATAAVLRPGTAPASSGGPTITATANPTVVNGGTLAVAVASAAPFTAIYMYVGGQAVGIAASDPGGVPDYYEARLPASETSEAVLLTFPQTIPLDRFQLLFAVADQSGRVGPYVGLATSVTSVGTGDVQVTLSWDVDSDVDLHVVDPSGEEVYYAHRSSASGGSLDLDSNAGCNLDHVRNENITWPVGHAPRGQYTVRVDYWASCNVAQTNYTVRINNSGSPPQIFSGSFTGAGDQGGRGSGTTIATFERATGPAAAAIAPSRALSIDSPKALRAPGDR